MNTLIHPTLTFWKHGRISEAGSYRKGEKQEKREPAAGKAKSGQTKMVKERKALEERWLQTIYNQQDLGNLYLSLCLQSWRRTLATNKAKIFPPTLYQQY